MLLMWLVGWLVGWLVSGFVVVCAGHAGVPARRPRWMIGDDVHVCQRPTSSDGAGPSQPTQTIHKPHPWRLSNPTYLLMRLEDGQLRRLLLAQLVAHRGARHAAHLLARKAAGCWLWPRAPAAFNQFRSLGPLPRPFAAPVCLLLPCCRPFSATRRSPLGTPVWGWIERGERSEGSEVEQVDTPCMARRPTKKKRPIDWRFGAACHDKGARPVERRLCSWSVQLIRMPQPMRGRLHAFGSKAKPRAFLREGVRLANVAFPSNATAGNAKSNPSLRCGRPPINRLDRLDRFERGIDGVLLVSFSIDLGPRSNGEKKSSQMQKDRCGL
jgi:hypothetical protein